MTGRKPDTSWKKAQADGRNEKSLRRLLLTGDMAPRL